MYTTLGRVGISREPTFHGRYRAKDVGLPVTIYPKTGTKLPMTSKVIGLESK
jgi:hypothetical protein